MAVDLETVVKELGIDKLSKEEQEPLVLSLLDTLQTRIGLRLAERLDEEQVEEFERLSRKGDEASLRELDEKFPAFKQAYYEECAALLEDFKALG